MFSIWYTYVEEKCLKILCLNSSTDGASFRSRCKLFQARMQDGIFLYLWFVYWVVDPGSLNGLLIIDNYGSSLYDFIKED